MMKCKRLAQWLAHETLGNGRERLEQETLVIGQDSWDPRAPAWERDKLSRIRIRITMRLDYISHCILLKK